MDKSIPAPAAHILKFIYSIEAPMGYDTIYGNNQHKMAKPLTSMTFDDVVKDGPNRTKKYGSSAAGAAQFMRDTLDDPKSADDLKGQMGLTGKELFTPDLQDRMAYHLLKRRGYLDFMSGKISLTAFGKALAQEWASFPVLAATQGAHRKVARGETYYAGDKLNKALVPPQRIETLLREAKAMGSPAPVANIPDAGKSDGEVIDQTAIAQVQERLFALGYTEVGSRRADGTYDGKVGVLTKAAILAFRNDNGLPVVDYVDMPMLVALMTAKPRNLAPDRTAAKPADIREQVPEAKAAWWSKISAWIAGIVSAIGLAVDGVIDNLDGARGWLEPVKNIIGDVPLWVWFAILGAGALFLWQKSRNGEVAIQNAYQTGERR